MDTKAALAQEWTTLQNNYERYEGTALQVKLVAVLLFSAGVALPVGSWLVCLVMLVLWLQEGIFKTYQARLGGCLLELERLLADPAESPGHVFQLHTAWLAHRRGAVALVAEYLRSACRPTVAFPYALLFAVGLVLWSLE